MRLSVTLAYTFLAIAPLHFATACGDSGVGSSRSTNSGGFGEPAANSGGSPLSDSAQGGTGGTEIQPTPRNTDGLTPVERHGQLRVQGSQLINAAGNPVQLKGASSMWLNWENEGYAENLEGVRWMRDNWNLSLIRAAMGVEPSGAYLDDPEKAKAQVRTIVENAVQLGIYVIIDWHDHEAQIHQAEAEAFFLEMANEYGQLPNVIYETFNEPLQVSWAEVLRPYHQALVETIRAVDSDNLIILGTPNWSQYVDEAAAAPVEGSNLLYTLHFYSCTHMAGLRTRADAALSRGIGLFVTEWGATHSDGGTDGAVCLDEAQAWHNWMNEKSISWSAWKFDNCSDSTCYFGPAGPSVAGPFPEHVLNGHTSFVRDRMNE